MPALSDFPSISQVTITPVDTGQGVGRSYEVDTSFEAYRRQSTRHTTIPSQRESINLEGKSGEGTVNTEGLWRVNAPDWSYGAGQLYADRAGSVANRFLASTGVDVLTTQCNASLLPAVKQLRAETAVGCKAVTIGPYVFWTNDSVVHWTTDWVTINDLTMTDSNFPTEFILGITHDTANVYIGTTVALYQCQVFAGATPPAAQQVILQACTPIGCEGGRIFVNSFANQNHLYDVSLVANPTNPPALPTDFNGGLLSVHSNPKWVWVDSALVDGTFYFTGIPLDHDSVLIPNCPGEVWRTSVQSTNQTGAQNPGMPAPVLALTLPPGEVCNSMFGYTNYCILGTTQGVRVCRSVNANDPTGNTGDLVAGPLVPNLLQPVGGWVTGFTAHGRFVYFTWAGYNDTFVGGTINNGPSATNTAACVLGRLDLQTFVDDLQPAYASGLVASQAGYMWSLAWDPITNGPIISIATHGIYGIDSANKVASGFIDSGLVTNNIPDDKIAAMISVRRDAAGKGAVSFKIQADGGGYSAATPISPNTPSSTPTLLSTLVRYEEANVSTILTRDGSTPSTGPTLKRWILKSIPAVVSGTTVSVVAMLYSQVASHGVKRAVDPYAELNWLEGLRLSQQPVTYQEGNPNGNIYTATATIDSIDWLPEHERDTQRFGWDGVAVIYLKSIVG